MSSAMDQYGVSADLEYHFHLSIGYQMMINLCKIPPRLMVRYLETNFDIGNISRAWKFKIPQWFSVEKLSSEIMQVRFLLIALDQRKKCVEQDKSILVS